MPRFLFRVEFDTNQWEIKERLPINLRCKKKNQIARIENFLNAQYFQTEGYGLSSDYSVEHGQKNIGGIPFETNIHKTQWGNGICELLYGFKIWVTPYGGKKAAVWGWWRLYEGPIGCGSFDLQGTPIPMQNQKSWYLDAVKLQWLESIAVPTP